MRNSNRYKCNMLGDLRYFWGCFLMGRKNYLAIIIVLITLVITTAKPAVAAEGTITRISGPNRYDTAVAISQEGWTSADTVVLARGDEYADALAGVSLAHAYGAPILLTPQNTLATSTATEITRLQADNVVILGGAGAVSETVEVTLQEMGLNVERIFGSNRIETASQIAAVMYEIAPFDTAILAYGYNFPDALAVASYAAVEGYPILLVNKEMIPQATAEVISQLGIHHFIIAGGSSAISDGLLEKLVAETKIRISGSDRFATAVALSDHFQPSGDRVYLASGENFVDAITGGVLAAKHNSPLLLVRSNSIPAVIEDCIFGTYNQVSILGGAGAVSETAASQLAAKLFSPMILPLQTVSRVTSNYGPRTLNGTTSFHRGIDLVGSDKIVAVADGIVVGRGESPSAGNYIVLGHSCGTYTFYYHCSTIRATTGSTVTQGTHIADVGSTGDSTGPHLHFEVRTLWQGGLWLGKYIDATINPADFVPTLKDLQGWKP